MDVRSAGSTQTEYVRSQVEERIFRGLLRPGQRIDEASLAEQLGTSRTPVREALTQLVSSGLLQKSPRQGAVVAKLTLEETLALMEYSAELAAACARFAARRMTKADRAGLRARCEALERYLDEDDVAAYTTEASRFHSAIIEYSRNNFLTDAIGRSVLHLAGYFRFDLTYPGSMRRDIDDHWRLMGAFERADPDEARAIMRRHALLDADVIRDYLAFLEADVPLQGQP